MYSVIRKYKLLINNSVMKTKEQEHQIALIIRCKSIRSSITWITVFLLAIYSIIFYQVSKIYTVGVKDFFLWGLVVIIFAIILPCIMELDLSDAMRIGLEQSKVRSIIKRMKEEGDRKLPKWEAYATIIGCPM